MAWGQREFCTCHDVARCRLCSLASRTAHINPPLTMLRKFTWTVALVALATGCAKKDASLPASASAAPDANAAPSTPSASTTTATTAPADSTDAQRELARKQAKLDYGTMEDGFMNDATAQWAASVTASSSFGQSRGEVAASNAPTNAAGPVDDKSWTNDKQDVGFDWLEATVAKPVSATAVRVVTNTNGVESINKIELQDVGGAWHSVWSGLSDQKQDSRGSRTWFVKTFERTTYQVKAVKITFANNVSSGYKEVNALQVVGQ
jgi:hypothetical protein